MVIVNLFKYFIDHLSEIQNMNKLIPQKVGVAILLPMVLTCMHLKAQEVYDNDGLKVNLNLEMVKSKEKHPSRIFVNDVLKILDYPFLNFEESIIKLGEGI